MLKTTSVLLGGFIGKPVNEVTLDQVSGTTDGFRRFLESRKYAKNSIRTYVNHLGILMRLAREHGWKPNISVPPEWREVLELSKIRKCSKLVLHLTRFRDAPKEVTIDDVEDWARTGAKEGKNYSFRKRIAARFWHLLLECKCTDPDLIHALRQTRFGIPLRDFPVTLKAEVEALLKWKQSTFAVGRPKGAKVRAVTAKTLEGAICRLMGYASSVLKNSNVDSLEQLVTREVVGGYVEWSLNERRVKGRSLMLNLSHLYGAMKQHPSYAPLDFKWLKTLLDEIPLETDSERRQRKAEKFLEYEVIESISEKIRAARIAASKRGKQPLAMLAVSELLIRWLLVLPWRQRNLRECRIGGSNPNLFKGTIPLYGDIEKPNWVRLEEQKNPDAKFWMIRFKSDETKTKNEPKMFLPRQLVEPLEEYLEKYRPNLVRGKDPGTLFTNSAGNPLRALELTRLVSQATLRFGGRRVTPHLFRDIFAYTWLREHPKDFLTVSKMLWHSNINTTIRIYGSRFNESSAVCAMETWLEERAAATKVA